MKESEVVIAGGGPVGMGLAIELGQRGIQTTVIERHYEPQPVPKGQNLTQRTMEHLHFWGVDDDIRKVRPIPKGTSGGGIVAYRELFGRYSYDWLHRSLVGAYYFQQNERLPQYDTENVLRRRAESIPYVDVRYGWDVKHVTQDANGVTVDIGKHRGQDREELRACYAVGCDGSKSGVREEAGIATKALSEHRKLMVLLVFRSAELHRMLTQTYPGKAFFCVLHPDLAGYWRFFGRVDLENTFFFHAPVPAETTRDNFDFPALLQRAAGRSFDVDIRHIGFWDLRFIVAQRYRNGRVFIGGDAAHSHPPYGGYGVNTGFEDARNLGWKLAACLRGWGGQELLDSYSAERQPVFQSTADDFIAKAIDADRAFLDDYDPSVSEHAFVQHWAARTEGAKAEVDVFEPNYEGSPIAVAGSFAHDARPSAKGKHQFIARAGHHLAPVQLSSGRNIYEVLGDAYTLLAFGASERLVGEFERAADQLGVPLKIIRDRVNDETGKYQAALVLVRPDHFVAWANGGEGVRDVIDVLDTSIGRLRSRS